MSTFPATAPPPVVVGPVEGLRRRWGLLVFFGVILVLVGGVAVSAAFYTDPTDKVILLGMSAAAVIFFGIVLMVGGVVEIINALFAHCWRGFFVNLLTGILYLILGLFMLEQTGRAILVLTLMVAAGLTVGGILRIVVALAEQCESWGWMLLSGVISVALGISIWRHWPEDAWWVLGLFIGIDMLFTGWTWIMLGLGLRNVGKAGAMI
jgi:uncharacterized membrane protein HdeD (DUF308 family)